MKNFLLLTAALLLSGCSVSKNKMYHPEHGYADNNPYAYNMTLDRCTSDAYRQFPPRPYPQLREMPQFPQTQGLSVGMAMRQGNIMAEVDRYNKRAIQEYETYNYQRESFIGTCMNQAGWGLVTVKEELL